MLWPNRRFTVKAIIENWNEMFQWFRRSSRTLIWFMKCQRAIIWNAYLPQRSGWENFLKYFIHLQYIRSMNVRWKIFPIFCWYLFTLLNLLRDSLDFNDKFQKWINSHCETKKNIFTAVVYTPEFNLSKCNPDETLRSVLFHRWFQTLESRASFLDKKSIKIQKICFWLISQV